MEKHEFTTIKLESAELKGGMPLFEALANRKSHREFDKTKFLSFSKFLNYSGALMDQIEMVDIKLYLQQFI